MIFSDIKHKLAQRFELKIEVAEKIS